LGGAVFVRQGGTLRIIGGSISGSSVTAGSGSGGGTSGSSEGGAVYLHTGTTLTYEVAAAATSTVANQIGGTGALTKEGAGTLTLQGANTYTGGTTQTAGTIRIENIDGLGTGTLTQSAGTVLIVDASGTIENSMSLYRVDFLQGVTLSGNLTLNNATFDVASGQSAILSGGLSGAGGITKNGAGTLTVTGANTFTGASVLNAGTLVTTTTTALGTGDVTLTAGTLQIQSKLNLGGALAWANNAATVVIDSVESGQFIEVAGNLSPAGGTKTFDVTNSALSENQRYALLSAANLNTFTTANFGITIDPAFQYSLQIDAGTLYIRLTSTDYTVYAQTPNQQQVATALNVFPDATSGDRVTVTTALNDLAISAYGAAFEQCMPALYSSMPTLAFNTANAVNTKLFERLWLTRVGAVNPGLSGGPTESSSALAPPASTRDPLGLEPDQNWSTFLDGNGIFATANSGGAMSNYRSQSGGMTAGAMYKFMEGFDAGLYVGYQYLHSGYAGDSQLQDNAARFGLLGSWAWPGLDPVEETVWVNGLVGGAWHNYDVDRGIAFGTIDRTADSTPGAGEFDLAVGTGYDLKEGNFTFGPAASVQYTYLGVQSFNETGAESLDLAVNSFNSSSCLFTLGGQAAYRWEVNDGLVITPMVSASWQHEFLQDAYTIGSAFDTGGPSSPFNYTTSAPERNFFYGGAGVSVAIDSRWQVIALWNCAAGNADLISQNVYLSLNAKF
jgi:outer membrane autotransporter protein